MNQQIKQHPASFRDPSGFVYEKDGNIFRFVSEKYKTDFELLQSSGLAAALIKKNLLLSFTQLNENHTGSSTFYTTLQPQKIPFTSNPWEWCFDELKDAALTTLRICRTALEKGMILKDATPFNIQLVDGNLKLIDTLSFEQYKEGKPWVAYKQFCESFLNPLLLASYCNLEVHRLFLAWPEGVPVVITSELLPFKTRLVPSVYLHVYLHAASYKKKKGTSVKKPGFLSQKKLEQILQSLEDCITSLQLKANKTTWNNYYEETILSNNYLAAKKELVCSWLTQINYNTVVDLGANEGEFSILIKKEAFVVAADFDSTCINSLYRKVKKEKQKHILPLVLDINWPSPAIGWANTEKSSFIQRSAFDLCLALALVHHLAIGKNIPLQQVVSLLALLTTNWLVVEFVPKNDPKVNELLQWREDIFDSYTQEAFENALKTYFILHKKEPVPASGRILYLCQKINTLV